MATVALMAGLSHNAAGLMAVAEVRPFPARPKSEIGGWQFWCEPTEAICAVAPVGIVRMSLFGG